MMLIIIPTEEWRLRDFEVPIPHILSRKTFPAWSEDDLEMYGKAWVMSWRSDIVMWAEDDPTVEVFIPR